MYVVTTGSRDLSDREPVVAFLEQCLQEATERFEKLYVFVGDCPTGADLFVRQWASERRSAWFHVRETIYEALWRDHGKGAGPMRNEKMVLDAAMLQLDGVLVRGVAWYQPGAKNWGTRNCEKLMREYHIAK